MTVATYERQAMTTLGDLDVRSRFSEIADAHEATDIEIRVERQNEQWIINSSRLVGRYAYDDEVAADVFEADVIQSIHDVQRRLVWERETEPHRLANGDLPIWTMWGHPLLLRRLRASQRTPDGHRGHGTKFFNLKRHQDIVTGTVGLSLDITLESLIDETIIVTPQLSETLVTSIAGRRLVDAIEMNVEDDMLEAVKDLRIVTARNTLDVLDKRITVMHLSGTALTPLTDVPENLTCHYRDMSAPFCRGPRGND